MGRTLPGPLQTSSVRSGFGLNNWLSSESFLTQESLGYQWDREHIEVVSYRCTGQARLA